jgi:hypothetical protein
MIRRFAVRHHKLFVLIFLASSTLLVAGCAGTFFSEAPAVIQAVIASVAAISAALSFVPGLGAAATAISAILNIASQEATEIETLIQQYQTTPDETTLQKIEAGIQETITNINQLLAPTGLPAALATKIGSIAQVILDQFEAWAALIKSIKTPTTSTGTAATPSVAAVLAAGPKLLTAEQFKKKVNELLESPTGDPDTDAAFAKAPRL